MKERKRVEGEGKIHRGFPVLLFGPLVEPFRGDGHGGFFLRVIFDLSLLSSCFSLLGVDKGGESPIIVRNTQGMGKENNREKQYMPWLSGL